MNDTPWRRDEIESPCVQICMINPRTKLCIGCKRTAEEIAQWSRLTPDARRAVMTALPDRPDAPGRQGGRAGLRR